MYAGAVPQARHRQCTVGAPTVEPPPHQKGNHPMSKPRSPLSLARRWTAAALLAATLGAGSIGVRLAADQGTVTASSAGTTSSSSGATTSSRPSSAGTAKTSGSSSFGAVPGVSSGTGSAQSSTSGS